MTESERFPNGGTMREAGWPVEIILSKRGSELPLNLLEEQAA